MPRYCPSRIYISMTYCALYSLYSLILAFYKTIKFKTTYQFLIPVDPVLDLLLLPPFLLFLLLELLSILIHLDSLKLG